MDNQNTTDANQKPLIDSQKYQEILDKYSHQLASDPPTSPGPDDLEATPEIPQPPVENTLPPLPDWPILEPAPPADNPVSPPSLPSDTPFIADPINQPATLPPPPELPPPLPPVSAVSSPSPSGPSRGLKILFFLSLIIFVGVALTLAYTMFKQSASTPAIPESDDNTNLPVSQTSVTPSPAVGQCQLTEDQKYPVGQTFPAADGCNTCTCQSDLTITCTQDDCSAASTSLLKTFSKTYGFSFKYPSDIKVVDKSRNGDVGKLAFISLEKGGKELLAIGGISPDFEEGRSGTITDTQGFLKKGNEYYYKFVTTFSNPIKPELITKVVKNNQNIEILYFKGEDQPDGEEGPPLWPSTAFNGALFNTTNSTYPGFALIYSANLTNADQKIVTDVINSITLTK